MMTNIILCSVLLMAVTIFESSCVRFEPLEHANWPHDVGDDCGVSYSDRIIGGTNAALGQYPWIARIGSTFNSTFANQIVECLPFSAPLKLK